MRHRISSIGRQEPSSGHVCLPCLVLLLKSKHIKLLAVGIGLITEASSGCCHSCFDLAVLVGIGEPTLHVRFVCLLRSITTDELFEIIVPLGITDEGGTGGREGVKH